MVSARANEIEVINTQLTKAMGQNMSQCLLSRCKSGTNPEVCGIVSSHFSKSGGRKITITDQIGSIVPIGAYKDGVAVD